MKRLFVTGQLFKYMEPSNHLNKYSLRYWVLSLMLIPTVVIGCSLGYYFTTDRFDQLTNDLINKAQNILQPIAIVSPEYVINNDHAAAKKLLSKIQLQHSDSVHSIALFNEKNQLFISSNYYQDLELMRYQRPLTELTQREYTLLDDRLLMFIPLDDELHYQQLDLTHEMNRHANNPYARHASLGYAAIIVDRQHIVLERYYQYLIGLAIFGAGIYLCVLSALFLIRRITNPISELSSAIQDIRSGRPIPSMDKPLAGELEALKQGILEMAKSIHDYQDETQLHIEQATKDISLTLTQMEMQNIELEKAKKNALAASKTKSEFLANMSHELRTPLNGVIGFARQLLKTPMHQTQVEYIRTIERSAESLLKTINDILDFSKIEAGKLIIEQQPFTLRDMLEDCLELLANQAREKEIELVLDVQHDIPENVIGDAMRFNQVLTNLIGNALKFTQKGSVHLKITMPQQTAEQLELHCEVIDTGIGISPTQQEHLFQAFTQADPSISRRFGGTGLGLVITKHTVQAMNGKIGFSSTLDQGSNFWFTLPLHYTKLATGQHFALTELKQASVLLIAPSTLTYEVLCQRLRQWQMQLSYRTDLNGLNDNETIDAFTQQYTYGIVSRKLLQRQALAQSIDLMSRICQQILIIDDLYTDPLLEAQHPAIDKVLSLPICDNALIRAFMFPNIKKQHNVIALSAQSTSLSQSAFSPFSAFSRQPAQRHVQASRAPISVLAVDDNSANLQLIEHLLLELCDNVTVVDSGHKAIQLSNQQRFDLIFMDIQMPETDGLMATQIIRSNSMNQKTPIIAVTAHTLAEEKTHILNSGMDGHLAKPIDENALRREIQQRLTAKATNQEALKTFDWQQCLRQSNHKPELALDMIRMLLNTLPKTEQEIHQALAEDDAELMRHTIHKLHGTSCYCGIPNTQTLCHTIESGLLQSVKIFDLEPEILELLDELTKVNSALTQMMTQSADQPYEQKNRFLQTPEGA